MASDHVSSDPVSECQRVALKHDSLCPGTQFQENVTQSDKTVTTSNELDLLFSLMFDELLNGSSKVVSKSSAVSTADAPNQCQQYTTPLNTHTTPAPTYQVPTQVPTVTSNENMNQAEKVEEYAQVENDEFINIFCTPIKDHPLEQVIGNPSQSVRTRRQLESDGEMCMFALTVAVSSSLRLLKPNAHKLSLEPIRDQIINLIRTQSMYNTCFPPYNNIWYKRVLRIFLENLPEHPSDTKVFTVKMEILLEPTSNKLLVGTSSVLQPRSSKGTKGGSEKHDGSVMSGLAAKVTNINGKIGGNEGNQSKAVRGGPLDTMMDAPFRPVIDEAHVAGKVCQIKSIFKNGNIGVMAASGPKAASIDSCSSGLRDGEIQYNVGRSIDIDEFVGVATDASTIQVDESTNVDEPVMTKRVNFRTLVNEECVVNHDTVLPKAAKEGVMSRYANTLVGYFVEDELSLIATQVGKPIMKEVFTSSMCVDSWGRISFARAFIEMHANLELKKKVRMAIPIDVDDDDDGTGYISEVIHVEYEWTSPYCFECKIFRHNSKKCPKKVSAPEVNGDSSANNNDGFTEVINRRNKGKKVANQMPKNHIAGIHFHKPKSSFYRLINKQANDKQSKKKSAANDKASTSGEKSTSVSNAFDALNSKEGAELRDLNPDKDVGKTHMDGDDQNLKFVIE
uniref:Zinc knuckle CX2CX4HX4C n=1 Tax=Tanacetum cinerariifolium TaxID=118510 RepID=A0A6L2L9S5_TANCI|nr:hypothetical protein [Tanacetum cinerariifolium]